MISLGVSGGTKDTIRDFFWVVLGLDVFATASSTASSTGSSASSSEMGLVIVILLSFFLIVEVGLSSEDGGISTDGESIRVSRSVGVLEVVSSSISGIINSEDNFDSCTTFPRGV